MTSSTGKIFGIILLVFIILLIAWPVQHLLFSSGAPFSGIFDRWPFHSSRWDGDHWPFFGIVGLTIGGLALFALLIAVLVWVYRDAESRGMSGILWALIVFIGHIVGLIIYLIVRSDHPVRAPSPAGPSPVPGQPLNCRQCGKMVDRHHAFCPYCGARVEAVCPKCAKPVEKGWVACPACGEKL